MDRIINGFYDYHLKKQVHSPLKNPEANWTTKIYMVAAMLECALIFSLSLGIASDAPEGRKLLFRLDPPPEHRSILTDSAYEGNKT